MMPAPILTPLLSAINFSSTTVAIIAIASVLVVVLIAIKSAFFVIGLIRGQVYYAGKWWDNDVYVSALQDVKHRARKGQLVDSKSRRAVKRYEGTLPRDSSNRIPSTRI